MTNNTNDKSTDSMKRRTVLKSTSAAAVSMGIFGTGAVAATPAGDTIRLVESGIKFDVEAVDPNVTLQQVANDEPPRYIVNEEKQQLLVPSIASEEVMNTFRQKSRAVVEQDHVTERALVGGKSTSFPSLRLASDFRTTKTLSLTDSVRVPELRLNIRDRVSGVSVENKQTSVTTGAEKVITLPSQTATANAYKYSGDGTQRYETTTPVTLTPRVTVRDRGQLEVLQDQR
ncbi:hypothetical protein V5735_19615 [Haladaptatus sp. SPP-AMP-3]|uniref:hypothetical protein n=1 Tax=Haladaptatus sp. SPP-AMP-3 TaxID=3121295 RepID=UPI003C2CF438